MVTEIKKNTAEPEKVTGSIAHATEILICLSKGIHKISDISRETNFSKSTVHRVLKLMEQSQLALQDNFNRRYYLGPLIAKLADSSLTTHRRLITCADAEMRRLSYVSEETVVLNIMMGLKFVTLHGILSRHNLRVSEDNKKTASLYSGLYVGASAKVLLAQLDDQKLKMLMKIVNIYPVTGRTITDKKTLLTQLLEIRKLGYTVSRGERIPGTICVAVPVYHYTLPVGLSVVGPDIRLQPRVKQVITELRMSSIKISKNIAGMFGERK